MDKERYELHVVEEGSADAGNMLEVSYPLYFNCYCEALGAILKNIDLMEEEYKREQIRQKKRNKKQFLLKSDISDINCSEFANIIAFIGTRGSGKTTAVNEFCDILSRYGSEEEEWRKHLSYKSSHGKQYRFWIMPPIDASVLEAKEDLIELIWANMYQAFEAEFRKKSGTRNGDELSKRIMKEFDEVYKNYNNVGHSEKREVLGESVLVKLKNVSSSLKTREAFEKLVKNFLDMLDDREESGYGEGDSYLVITVDDLDLNLEKGYEMLEQLHKYLFNRRIIVLIAVDFEHLHLLSEKHFMESLMPQIPTGAYNGNESYGEFGAITRKVKKLNDDYLLKVLPLSNRIYLSGGNIISRRIMVSESAEEAIGKKETVKAFILKKIVDKTLIYYDACGKKKHFCLPKTIRELASYNHFLNSLYSMEEIEAGQAEGNCGSVCLYDQNHDRFNFDITDRMAIQSLNDKQLYVFRLIMERNIERRAEYAVNFIQYYKKGRLEALKDKVDEREYRYGDLLREIYDIGRKRYYDKVLCHCILASFTSEMVREYYSFCSNCNRCVQAGTDEARRKCTEDRERAERRLRSFLGSTFGGEWFVEEMPKAVIRGDRSKAELPMGYFVKRSNAKIIFEKKLSIDINRKNGVEKIIDQLAEYVPYLECISFLLSNLSSRSGKIDFIKWNFEFEAGDTILGSKSIVRMQSEVWQMDFDLFGFIGREIKEDSQIKEEFLNSFSENLYEDMKSFLVKAKKTFTKQQLEEWKDRIELKTREKSIWKEENETGKNVIYFPFYNLDMTYNVMKRVRHRMKQDPEVEKGDICKYFKRVYAYVAEELDKEDKAYMEMGIPEQNGPKLLETFNRCPFIKAFGYGYGCEEENKENVKNREEISKEVQETQRDKQGNPGIEQEKRPKIEQKGSLKEDELNDFLLQIMKGIYTPYGLDVQNIFL